MDMSRYHPIIRAMTSARGLDREYTRGDILNRSDMDAESLKSDLISGVKMGVFDSALIGSENNKQRLYRLTQAGKDEAQAMAAGGTFKTRRVTA